MRTTSTVRRDAELLRRAATALAAEARSRRAGELTLTQVAVLGRVATTGPITPSEVAAQLRMQPQSLTRPLSAIERAGYVVRTPDPTDGRGSLLHATEDGLAALRAEMAPRNRWVAEAMAATCSDDDRRVLVQAAEIMGRLVEHAGGVAPVEP